jgi:hypothetical protein
MLFESSSILLSASSSAVSCFVFVFGLGTYFANSIAFSRAVGSLGYGALGCLGTGLIVYRTYSA